MTDSQKWCIWILVLIVAALAGLFVGGPWAFVVLFAVARIVASIAFWLSSPGWCPACAAARITNAEHTTAWRVGCHSLAGSQRNSTGSS